MSQTSAQHGQEEKSATDDRQDALVKGMSLIVEAIRDPDMIGRCSSEDMRTELSLQLVESYAQLLKGMASIFVVSTVN